MNLPLIEQINLHYELDLDAGRIAGVEPVVRHLSDLRGVFADQPSYENALAAGNPMVYQVSSVEPSGGPGDMHFGLGVLMPGKIAHEFFLTKGHLHTHRDAAEIYFGLRGQGAMLLEDEHSGASRMVRLDAGSVVYVPGHTAHRTYNVGQEPLIYLGSYPAEAGHDYGAIADRNFRQIIVDGPSGPVMMDRSDTRDTRESP